MVCCQNSKRAPPPASRLRKITSDFSFHSLLSFLFLDSPARAYYDFFFVSFIRLILVVVLTLLRVFFVTLLALSPSFTLSCPNLPIQERISDFPPPNLATQSFPALILVPIIFSHIAFAGTNDERISVTTFQTPSFFFPIFFFFFFVIFPCLYKFGNSFCLVSGIRGLVSVL